jgi:hypothetical protein
MPGLMKERLNQVIELNRVNSLLLTPKLKLLTIYHSAINSLPYDIHFENMDIILITQHTNIGANLLQPPIYSTPNTTLCRN